MYAWAPRMEPIDQLSNCELETKKGVRMCGSCAAAAQGQMHVGPHKCYGSLQDEG